MRGEDRQAALVDCPVEETPPRAWGRQGIAQAVELRTGNTPTCVGKTAYPPLVCCRGRKHPHVRGEDKMENIWLDRYPETPPRAWGRHQYIVKEQYPTTISSRIDFTKNKATLA